MKVAAAKKTLGGRRYRMAMLYFVRKYTQQQIARSMQISQPFVSKELKKINRQFSELRVLFRSGREWAERSSQLGLLPSLN